VCTTISTSSCGFVCLSVWGVEFEVEGVRTLRPLGQTN